MKSICEIRLFNYNMSLSNYTLFVNEIIEFKKDNLYSTEKSRCICEYLTQKKLAGCGFAKKDMLAEELEMVSCIVSIF